MPKGLIERTPFGYKTSFSIANTIEKIDAKKTRAIAGFLILFIEHYLPAEELPALSS
ncbi:hypothetical protein [Okeania sp. SIO2B3]|uniref:hypothetical protein n=1 Tax=Okeania sp. SIO2B3 TaxID=2607784 RepID=UPI0013C1A252|nr:hypothetical protein [Okeania sp. SIO2B3]NET45452.1 hypothetical protein [Okeania sp. SIO2B3]